MREAWVRYGIAVLTVAAGFGLRRLLTIHAGEGLPTYITFYPAVMVTALLAGVGPGFLATALAVVLADLWIASPGRWFLVAGPTEVTGTVLFSFMGVFLSLLIDFYRRARQQGAAFEKALALRESQQALQAERDFVSAVLDTAGALVVVLDAEGRIQRFNHACEQATGYGSDEVIGRTFWTFLLLPEEADAAKVVFGKLRAGEFPNRHENHWIGKDGARRLIAWSSTCITGPDGHVQFVVATGIDVTEQRQAEAAFHETAEQHRLALEAGSLGTWDYNFVTGTVFWDEPCRNLFGVAQGDHIDYQKAIGIIHKDDRERVDRAVQAALAPSSAGAYECEYRVVWPDGTTRWVMGKGRAFFRGAGPEREPQRFIGTVRDVSGSKQAEAALRESELFYRQTLESIPGMVFTTRPDGYCDYQSQPWVEYTGVPMTEHLGDGWNKLLHPDDRPRAFAAWRDAVEGRAAYDIEYRVRRHDGVYEWFKVRGRPIRDTTGRIVRWFGTAVNVEDLKRAEAHLKASLREKEVLLQEVHHRVKNNLQVISSLINLQADALDQPDLRASLNDVRDRVRTMALVHEKLYGSDDLAQLNFADYAAGLLQYLWRAHGDAAGRVRLTLITEPVLLPVSLAVPCGLILNELATNALKHAFRGRSEGEVTVGLERETTSNRVCLRVSDNGAGLPTDLNLRSSSSLGLRLVQMLTQQIGGAVEVRRGPGTEFRMTFSAPEGS